MALHRIVSGGQTGADRAALDAALEKGFPCGGWCPAGRLADDGPLPSIYPLSELSSGGYRQRTIRNVKDSDGTVLFFFGEPIGGTELTRKTCVRLEKPHHLVDASSVSPREAAAAILDFTNESAVGVLNVAGPSERRTPGIYLYVREVIERLLELRVAGA